MASWSAVNTLLGCASNLELIIWKNNSTKRLLCKMPPYWFFLLRDWSVITGRGGYKTEGGGEGQVRFYPNERGGGADIVLAMLKGGGHKKFWVSFF